jgi:hypothetical protein
MRPLLPVLLSLASLSSGCIGVSVGTDDDEFFRMRGLGTAYAAVPGIDDYDGKIIRLGLLSRAPAGAQLAGIDIWPLCSVGVGLVGARVRVLPFEVGAGILFYEPKPVRRDLSAKAKSNRARREVTNEVHAQAATPDDVPVRRVEPAAPDPQHSPNARQQR